jgi:superfamily I DNA and/or RNA helicase
MRPEICQLMVHFYDDLENHESVLTERPSIIGVQKNLFFIKHNHPEETIVEGNSKQNKFEAEYILALAFFLIKQGYEKSQITILVMYLGQRALISHIIKSGVYNKALQGININVTDSFQGEENDIILLSLVRSNNANNTIGFLKIHNRICVALSRARCAMYIVGNLNFLMEHEDMWKNIAGTLIQANAVGTGKGTRLYILYIKNSLFRSSSLLQTTSRG